MLRTNAGYERWWEARKLWGGIVNQTRNLAIQAISYGPDDPRWRGDVVRWTIAFAHASRRSLRGERDLPEIVSLLGEERADRIAGSAHMPNAVARAVGGLLREAHDGGRMNGFAFHQAERERALLIDHIGACERILKTPLPAVYSIKIRRFLVLFLVTLTFALLHKFQSDWLVPPFLMLVAYPVLAVDQLGAELQNPFATQNLGHLPLDDICKTIEGNLLGLLEDEQRGGRRWKGRGSSRGNRVGAIPGPRHDVSRPSRPAHDEACPRREDAGMPGSSDGREVGRGRRPGAAQ